MKITDIEGFPKALLKKKEIPLYKAFIIINPDDVMNINSNIDILSITQEAAVASLVNELPLDEANELKGKVISFAIIKLQKDDLLTKDIVDEGEPYFENDHLSITLKDKIFKIDVEDKLIDELDITVDEKTEYRICTNIKLVNV